MSKRVITFGEIMLRLAPEGYYRFVQANNFGATYGGGEANVAVSLANYGFDAAFVTKLPKHEIGQAAVNELRRYGVDTSTITRGGDRVGIYFLEDLSPVEIFRCSLGDCGMCAVVDNLGRSLGSTLLEEVDTYTVTAACDSGSINAVSS